MPDITAQEIKTLLDFLQGIGAINANPTANTLQARLKAILDALNSGIEVSGPLTDAELRAAAVQVAINGSLATVTHSVATVTTATGAALAANVNRKYALLVNDSDTVIYIKIGANAVANQGIRLNANGGSYEMSNALGNLNTGAINAIHAGSGNKTLLVTEGV
jgi:hypothetical protein